MRGSRLIGMSTTITIACAATPAQRADHDQRVAAAQAFQRDYDQALRADEASFLTTVAAHYFGEGEPLEFELEGTRIDLLAGPDGLTLGIDEHEQLLRESGIVPVDAEGRWRLSVSLQDHEFRVLVHDRDAAARREFTGIAWFPIDAEAIVDARFEPLAVREPESLQTSRGVTKTLYLAGVYRFELEGRALALQAFAYALVPSEDEPLLIPFRDQTTGETSYGAGRYLEPLAGEAVLDFNRATNPACAYSEHYNCPMPPAFNRLDVAIEAGARAPAGEH